MTDSFTPTTNANAIPTVIAQETLKLLSANLGLAKFVSKDTDWTGRDFATYGNTLQIDKPGSLVVKKKTPGTPMVLQNPSDDKVTVTLNQHDYIDVLQEDITKLLQKPDMQAQYARNMAIKLGEGVESYIFSLHPNFTVTETMDYTSATTIESSFLRLRSRFSRLKVPQNEQKFVFLDTSVIDKLLSVEKYSRGDFIGNTEAVELGAIRRIYGINIFESQLVPYTGSPGAYHNFALTRYGIVLVNRPMPLDGNGKGVVQTIMTDPGTGLSIRLTEGYSHGDLGSRFTMDLLYGAALCDTNQAFEVESF